MGQACRWWRGARYLHGKVDLECLARVEAMWDDDLHQACRSLHAEWLAAAETDWHGDGGAVHAPMDNRALGRLRHPNCGPRVRVEPSTSDQEDPCRWMNKLFGRTDGLRTSTHTHLLAASQPRRQTAR